MSGFLLLLNTGLNMTDAFFLLPELKLSQILVSISLHICGFPDMTEYIMYVIIASLDLWLIKRIFTARSQIILQICFICCSLCGDLMLCSVRVRECSGVTLIKSQAVIGFWVCGDGR